MFERLSSYRLDEMLILISKEIVEIFNSKNAIKSMKQSAIVGDKTLEGEFLITPWELTQLAWFAVRESSDFAMLTPTHHDLLTFLDEVKGYDNEITPGELDGLSPEQTEMKIFFGLSQQQFGYQRFFGLEEDFNRNYELFKIVPERLGKSAIIESACFAELGLSYDELTFCLIAIWSFSLRTVDFSSYHYDAGFLKLSPCLTRENINRVMRYFSVSYDTIRKSALKENIFRAFPLICTTRNLIIPMNQFLLVKKIVDGQYWVARGYYEKKKQGLLQIATGEFFEKYLSRVLEHYLPASQFTRLEHLEIKNADWQIETADWIIIVEQKSSLAKLQLKKSFPDLEELEAYQAKIEECIEQLIATSERLSSSKPRLHFGVFLEELYLPELLMSKREYGIANLFFATIADFERLVFLLANEPARFAQIIQKKCDPEHHVDFSVLLQEVKNDYTSNVINHFAKFRPTREQVDNEKRR